MLDPAIWGADAVRTCSVCDGPVRRELRQAWISRRVGTDVLPLLVNACSAACIAALPQPHLTVAASAFISPDPVLSTDLVNPDGPPTLLCPAVRDIDAACVLWAGPNDRAALADLLGRTRSAVLNAIADGCGTGELAQRVRISPAAASQHAAVLRRAGLITTQRTGRSVEHALTALGSALLAGTSAAAAPADAADS